jgi:hypothetical protein
VLSELFGLCGLSSEKIVEAFRRVWQVFKGDFTIMATGSELRHRDQTVL